MSSLLREQILELAIAVVDNPEPLTNLKISHKKSVHPLPFVVFGFLVGCCINVPAYQLYGNYIYIIWVLILLYIHLFITKSKYRTLEQIIHEELTEAEKLGLAFEIMSRIQRFYPYDIARIYEIARKTIVLRVTIKSAVEFYLIHLMDDYVVETEA